VPAFAGATLAAVQGGFALFLAQSDPFHAAYAARLGMIDLVALCTLVGLVRYALVNRRHARPHASAMLSTAFLVLPPILARLVPLVPGFGGMSFARLTGFPLAFHIGASVAILPALGLYLADRRARPFLIVALSITVQSLMFETVGGSLWWANFAAKVVAFPTPLLVSIGVVLAAIALWQGWVRVPNRRPFGDAAVLGAS
jgi:hypothetical protein